MLSAGTERATLDVARKGLIAKARARPDQARPVLERMRPTGSARRLLVRQKLEELGPLGYSAAGVVHRGGRGDPGPRAGRPRGDRRGRVREPCRAATSSRRFCARRIPDGVSAEDAAFATLGAIAMNGFRRAEVQVGSTVAVIGLGLIGQLAVRIARAAGCRVLGVDLSPELVELARRRRRRRRGPLRARAGIALGGLGRRRSRLRGNRLERPGPRSPRARTRPGPRGDRRRRAHGPAAGALLRQGARPAPLALLRARPVRPQLRAPRARLPDRPRPLDRAAKHGGLPGPGGGPAR